MDNFSSGVSKIGEKIVSDFVEGDLQHYQKCLQATQGIDAVIHLAAKGNVSESIKKPEENFRNNAYGTLNILRASAQNGISKFILASTGGALMGNCKLPVSEDSIPSPISPYGASKLASEGYCHAFSCIHKMQMKILRFSNVYGPLSAHKTGIVNTVMEKIIQQKAICIFGDGKSTRDFIYVEDLCSGILKALENNDDGCKIFHLGTGIETSILELINKIIKTTHSNNIKINFADHRIGEVSQNFACFKKAKDVLNFNPTVTLEDGLKRTWSWYYQLFKS